MSTLRHLACNIGGFPCLQERSRLLKQLEERTVAWQARQGEFEGRIEEATAKTGDLEAQLTDAQNELYDTKVLLECAEKREADMSASIDVTEATMEETKEAMKSLKADLKSARTALESAQNGKLAVQARLKASEVRLLGLLGLPRTSFICKNKSVFLLKGLDCDA